ncbi:hypothetical protein BKA61DRAFT_572924 [Leptodontidium sp. MPI-SDFR-AT-0119]|nr:hypothetical protein BKA61DRAFT_572924 [Leptodontidium sp. MPI-SDFR-AT-0119]
MQLTTILTIALLAVGATAFPNPTPNSLMGRTDWWKCEGDKYDWIKWKCVCPYDTKYNEHQKKCEADKPYCPHPQKYNEHSKKCENPSCPHPQKYNEHSKKCENPSCPYPEKYNENGKKCEPPSCPHPQKYNEHSKKCERYPPQCPHKRKWDEEKKKCDYPPWNPPQCYNHENAYCSKSEHEYAKYDKKQDWCKDNSYNKVWCSKDHEASRKCKEKYGH